MSIEKSNTVLTILGAITAVITITVNVTSVGEIKGRLEETISNQDRRISVVETTVREHDRLIYQNLVKPNETKK